MRPITSANLLTIDLVADRNEIAAHLQVILNRLAAGGPVTADLDESDDYLENMVPANWERRIVTERSLSLQYFVRVVEGDGKLRVVAERKMVLNGEELQNASRMNQLVDESLPEIGHSDFPVRLCEIRVIDRVNPDVAIRLHMEEALTMEVVYWQFDVTRRLQLERFNAQAEMLKSILQGDH